MQLSPLQSRLAASLIASLLLIVLYYLLSTPTFALAAELRGDTQPVLDDVQFDDSLEQRSSLEPTYEPEFTAFDRSIIGRAPAGVTGLTNNVKVNRNVPGNSTQSFVFEAITIFANFFDGTDEAFMVGPREGSNESISPELVSIEGVKPDDEERGLRRRQAQGRTVYISATTCIQPQRAANNTKEDAPQITMYISTSQDNQTPGPGQNSTLQKEVAFVEGAATFSVNATGDVFIGIGAPSKDTDKFTGDWNFDVAASTDDFFHSFDGNPSELLWVDSDSSAALLTTQNLTTSQNETLIQEIMGSGLPFIMFVENREQPTTKGVRRSMCGLENYAQIAAKKGGKFGNLASTLMTTRGAGNLPKQQFFFNGLNASALYSGILVRTSNSSSSRKRQDGAQSGGGGKVFEATPFETKDGENCKIVTDLQFCNETEYAVPANSNKMNITQLAQFYDNYARDMYANFQKQLAQVACEAPAVQQYSLARNCSDCETAYKKWLCSVTIPRCEDFTSPTNFSLVRNVNQSFPNGTLLPVAQQDLYPNRVNQHSRNPLIDEMVEPGPYREILPCAYLCYDLVQSCPASLGFNCPTPDDDIFNSSYAEQGDGLTCNYPGAVHNPSGSSLLSVSWGLLSALILGTLSAVIL
ncbi:calcium influx-promoting protein ehs1 [Colletotrichum scovillei]|uniref:Calcium influx-promoting protein ehs1 n=1 Tax=Colletotrichum scovillei TaxID=1209932 RepID=A0A9P7RKB0_9PEZI|nr:calcium influx-promoting protein ehs1 [Colletotrichum scovillei]KAF4779708.1 calcium influx-promoting protein ehs1 [Colletotrichum scovillei]KAG7058085.1 calcium influx-promoting protein ehs1 [Colletotrichum scovillei]KAG7076661.1 calcium influx-promoting protein ehs1 [Colletotrichum scovillei]KAG7083877.1 calcium influx-promoting protein ehs1 [Colletotrichum scovillei]